MKINAKVLSVGQFRPASTFKGKEGNEIQIPAKRQLVVQQDCGDVIIVKARCEENTKFEVGKTFNFDVLNLAKANGMIFLDCDIVK